MKISDNIAEKMTIL